MFTGDIANWGLSDGDEVICVTGNDWDFKVGNVYIIESCVLFKFVLSHKTPQTSTIFTNSKFILPNNLSKLLYAL